MTDTGKDLDLLGDLLAKAKAAGAEATDAVLFDSVSLAHNRVTATPACCRCSRETRLTKGATNP